ncbi:malonate decarboxylase acyl carrier protein [Streptomyces sp. NPDC059740]|uniref:malonate decarboxylase acyl carrier protein n=1 Tax=Streptomyces sp. NPDC059740 TaxID=3346926 RepID=UPI0036497FBB
MEKLTYDFASPAPAARRARVGVVASGDLEILAVPRTDGRATVTVTTSVDGFGPIWQQVLDAFFARTPLAADLTVNDAGATPGTVALRLAQLKEIAA